MAKINSFVVTKIEAKSKQELILTALVNGLKEKITINIPMNGSFSFPEKLEMLLISKDFNQTRQFVKFLSDYLNGLDVLLPFVVLAQSKISQSELQTA